MAETLVWGKIATHFRPDSSTTIMNIPENSQSKATGSDEMIDLKDE